MYLGARTHLFLGPTRSSMVSLAMFLLTMRECSDDLQDFQLTYWILAE
jgi:hypothetical protein